MTVFALVRPDSSVDRRSQNIDPNVQTKPGFRWLPVDSIDPPYDSATQVKTGPVTTVEAARVLDTWTVRAKTAGEIDGEKDRTISRIDALQFAVSFDMENRVRVLEAKPQITAAQYRAALKARL